MHVIRTRNVHRALPEGLYQLESRGIPSPSRYGDVVVLPEPVTTVYSHPQERVLFWPERDANPFFHFMEGIWMIAGRNDVAFVARFAERMKSFSDDGKIFHGAYGYRWRKHWEISDADQPAGAAWPQLDQVELVLALLREHPLSRRAVISMWDPEMDLHTDEKMKDVPCNTQIYLWNLAGRIQMTVTCRSNDIIWGAYGANAVHFSMFHEYIAAMLEKEIGTFYQISNNFHAYRNVYDPMKALARETGDGYKTIECPYSLGEVSPYPMVANPKTWDRDLALFLEDPTSNGFDNPFFYQVAKPMWWAHAAWKVKSDPDRYAKAYDIIAQCQATDWRKAAHEWLERREAKAKEVG